MEKNLKNVEPRKTAVLKNMPETLVQVKPENKDKIKKSLDKILNKYFINSLKKEKIPQKEIINIAQKVQKAGYENVNQMMIEDYYFDLETLEFKKILSSNFLHCEKVINITIESSDEEGNMVDYINQI